MLRKNSRHAACYFILNLQLTRLEALQILVGQHAAIFFHLIDNLTGDARTLVEAYLEGTLFDNPKYFLK